jgi:hypothetical protein
MVVLSLHTLSKTKKPSRIRPDIELVEMTGEQLIEIWLSVGTTYLPRLPTRLAAGNSLRMNSGAYAPVR